MSEVRKPPEPSGAAWLIPVIVPLDVSFSGWNPGPAVFTLTADVRKGMKGHLQDSHTRVINAAERYRSWTRSSAELLLPSDPAQDSAQTRRWHRYASGSTLGGFPVACMELWTAPAASGSNSVGHLGVVIVHVATGEHLAPGPNLRDSLYETVRASEGRKSLLGELAKTIQLPLASFDLPGSREQVPTVYAVTTVTDLHEDVDEELLLAREIATLTPSRNHGSGTDDAQRKRIERSRSDLTRISDSWAVMVTSHGTAFIGSSGQDFVAAPTYVSTIYVDILATVILSEAIVVQLGVEIHETVGKLREEKLSEHILSTTMALRCRLLWLRSTLMRVPEAESRPLMLLSTQLAENLRLSSHLTSVEEDIDSLMEVASLHHQLAEERASQRLNTMLAILTVVALPLTMLYSGIDLLGGGNTLAEPWYWTVTASALVITISLIVYNRAGYRKRITSERNGGPGRAPR